MKFLAWHLGCGDAIAFADLAVKLADGGPLMVPCYAHNLISVQSLFVNHRNIDVHRIGDDRINRIEDLDVIKLGSYSSILRNEGEDMVEWMYRTAGMDPATRFDSQVVAKACAKCPQIGTAPEGETWGLVHHDPSRGFEIKREWEITATHDVLRVQPLRDITGADMSILSWANRITAYECTEIHCIDSSFLHLVEQLQPTGKLYYHKYARPQLENHKLRHNWTVIE